MNLLLCVLRSNCILHSKTKILRNYCYDLEKVFRGCSSLFGLFKWILINVIIFFSITIHVYKREKKRIVGVEIVCDLFIKIKVLNFHLLIKISKQFKIIFFFELLNFFGFAFLKRAPFKKQINIFLCVILFSSQTRTHLIYHSI